MAQTYESSDAQDKGPERPRVTVKYCGVEPLEWFCQHYTPDQHVQFSFEPGEEDKMEYNYARRVFGDWEVKPDESRDKLKEWSGMIAYTVRRSPSMDGKLAQVKIYDPDGNLLWDAEAQMERWLEYNAKPSGGFAQQAQQKGFGGPVAMPEILAKASYDQLKKLWLQSWGSKMPAGIKGDVAKEVLKPRMTAEQIKDSLADLYSGPEPDMSKYHK